MNYSTAIFLINDKTRAVYGTYEAGDNAARTLFKTLDQTIQKDDLVLVQTGTRHGFTVVKIVDADVEFDIETSTKIDWVVGKIDLATFQTLSDAEQDAIRMIQSAEKNRKREELRKSILADVEGKIGGMAIAAIGHESTGQPQS